MGCEYTKDDLEGRKLVLSLKREAIRQQRKKKIKEFEEMTGEKIVIEPIPDYLEDTTYNENKKIEQKEKIFNKNDDFDFGGDDDNN